MKTYTGPEIRNVAVVGHGDAGKTSLVSAMLFDAGVTSRLGRVDEGTTVTDYDEDEIERKITMHTALAHLEWKGTKINLLDTPGYQAFIHDARGAVRVADVALVVVDAVEGVQVQTEKAWSYAEEFGTPRILLINKLDRERADFEAALEALVEAFGRAAIPFQIPIGKERDFSGVVDVITRRAYRFQNDASGKFTETDPPAELSDQIEARREAILEMVAESSDELLEKFFAEGTLSDEDLLAGIRKAILEKRLFPVFAASAYLNIGIQPLLDALVRYAPAPTDFRTVRGRAGIEADAPVIERPISDDAPYSAFVFKTIADPFAGRITLFKVYSGVMRSDMTAYNMTKGIQERLGPLHVVQGKQLEKVPELHAGDIGAVTKLRETQTNDTFADKAAPIIYEPISFPQPAIAFAIEPKSRADEDKLSAALHRLLEEDLALRFERDPQTKDFLLSGTGQLHIETVVARLKKRYGVDVMLKLPKVPYRETFKNRVEAHGRHKKQTGGARSVRRLRLHLRAAAPRRGVRVRG